jgi:hypothetical protein
MILSIHQPGYFPWLGLLHKIANSDLYMLMDEVQLTDSAYQHRNLFLSADGKVKYLTIPFNKKNYLQRPFNELEIVDHSWRSNHLNFIKNGYQKHPYFDEIFPVLVDFYAHDYALLVDAVVASMRISLKFFNINTRIVCQSDVKYDRSLKRGDLVVNLVQASGADCYLSGVGAQEYLDEAAFKDGISLRYNYFTHPEYRQKNSASFVPGLSCLDTLFNLGVSASRGLLNELPRQ